MQSRGIDFSVVSHAAWAPGVDSPQAWQEWAEHSRDIVAGSEPALAFMPAMQRRRTGFLAKMALEVAHQCLGERTGIPMILVSRHGEVHRSVDLLSELAKGETLSPTSFGLSVHNAAAGLFSISRKDTANSISLSAGKEGLEHALIEACGLLADGESEVLLVACDAPLPELYAQYADEEEQPYAWAWLLRRAGEGETFSLTWSGKEVNAAPPGNEPGALDVLRFYLRKDASLVRSGANRQWQWKRKRDDRQD